MPDLQMPTPETPKTTPASDGKRHLPHSTWAGIVAAALLVLASSSTGLGGMLIMLSVIALGTAIYALVTHRRNWALLPKSRPVLVETAVASVVVLFIGSAVYGAQNPPEPEAPAAIVQSSSPTPTKTAKSATDETPLDPSTVTAPDADASVAITDRTATDTTAMALLETLPIKGRAPKTGYDRVGQFGTAWLDVDRNGCDTRNDILARDLDPETKNGPCKVMTGTLNDRTQAPSSTSCAARHLDGRADRSRCGAHERMGDRRPATHPMAADHARQRPDEPVRGRRAHQLAERRRGRRHLAATAEIVPLRIRRSPGLGESDLRFVGHPGRA